MKSMLISFGHAASHSPWQRARAEVALHRLDHVDDPLVALRLTLRQQAEVRDLGRGEQLRGTVRAGGHARAATDARGRVHRRVGRFLRHQDEVGVGRRYRWAR